LPIQTADVRALPFPDASFDKAISIEVLRYLPNATQAIREVARVLRPGGEFAGTVMSPFSLCGYPAVNLITRHIAFGGMVKIRHYFHSSRRISRMLKESGFGDVVVRPAAFISAPQKVTERLAPGIFRKSLRLFEPIDDYLSRSSRMSDFAMHIVFCARKIEK
jgi:ubiquinone/menaquinone biosynthesis C-methylase UbiE